MILRRLSQHVKDQNWFAVVLDFIIVVIGVGVALLGQQWLSDRTQRADMRVAEAALQPDLFYNYSNAKERLAVSACRAESLAKIGAQLLEPGETWTPMQRVDTVSGLKAALPALLRSPSRNWGSRNWEAGLARGTFNQMDEDHRDLLDALFKQTDHAEVLQSDIYTLQGRMKTLAAATTVSQSDRLRYYDMLGELDDKSGALELISGQIVNAIEEIGIVLSDDDRADALAFLPEMSARSATVYGDCFVPAEWTVLEDKATKEPAP